VIAAVATGLQAPLRLLLTAWCVGLVFAVASMAFVSPAVTYGSAPALEDLHYIHEASDTSTTAPANPRSGAVRGYDDADECSRSRTRPLGAVLATKAETEVVQRAMSRTELDATVETGLVRGGREGTHYASGAVNTSANRARQRLALPQTPELRVDLEVPRGAFGPLTRVEPRFGMPGGGMERSATGRVQCRVVRVRGLC